MERIFIKGKRMTQKLQILHIDMTKQYVCEKREERKHLAAWEC
jgi:hypothetical protein